MALFTIIIIGYIGACFGSFAYLVVCRFSPDQPILPYLSSILYRRSFCPNCSHKLTWFALFPIFSWIIQKGRCWHCSHNIPCAYPLVEIASALFFVIILEYYAINYWSIALLMLGLLFFILSAIDFRYYLLPDIFTLLIAIIGATYCLLGWSTISIRDALIGVVFGALLLGLPAISYFYYTKHEGLGRGDIKLLATLGFWIHYTQLPLLLLIASCFGLIYVIIINRSIVLLFNRALMQEKRIPFGPFILFSAYMILLTY